MKQSCLISFCLCLANCATWTKKHSPDDAPDLIPEDLRVAHHHNTDSVRHPEFVKSYYLGRRPSEDGKAMHEAHRVYTIGQSGTWNLLSSEPTVNGPVVAAGDSAKRPPYSSRELEAERRKQEELSTQLIEAQRALTDMQAQAEQRLPELQRYLLDVMRRGTNSKPAPSLSEEAETKDLGENSLEALRKWGERNDAQQ